MLLQILLFFSGLAGLYFGAEWLVKGASRLAGTFNIKPLIIGLTIVAFGTSAPELVTAVIAGVRDLNDIAIGNIIGSNIANIGLILGASAVIRPIKIEMLLLYREMPIVIGISALLFLIGWNGIISKMEGLLLLSGILAYISYVYRTALKESTAIEHEYEEFVGKKRDTVLKDIFLIITGLCALVGGAHLLVQSSVYIARALGISEFVVGLTVIAVGTSLPELATSLVAVIRNESDISVGNVLGSNIFNILAVLGTAALIRPLQIKTVLLQFDVPVMLAFSVFLVPVILWKSVITRWQGILLLFGYVTYILWLFF